MSFFIGIIPFNMFERSLTIQQVFSNSNNVVQLFGVILTNKNANSGMWHIDDNYFTSYPHGHHAILQGLFCKLVKCQSEIAQIVTR